MLRNLSPLVSGHLLRALDTVPAGGWIAITSRPQPDRPQVVNATVSIAELADALFDSVAVSGRADVPLIAWLEDASDDDALDAFFTVQGVARDAERRVLEMGRLLDLPEDALRDAGAVIVVPSPADFAFFVCVGQGEHTPAPLFGSFAELAA